MVVLDRLYEIANARAVHKHLLDIGTPDLRLADPSKYSLSHNRCMTVLVLGEYAA